MKFPTLPCFKHRQTRDAVATIHNPGASRAQLDDAERRLDRYDAKHAGAKRSCTLDPMVEAARSQLTLARHRYALSEHTFVPQPPRRIIEALPPEAQLGALPLEVHRPQQPRIRPVRVPVPAQAAADENTPPEGRARPLPPPRSRRRAPLPVVTHESVHGYCMTRPAPQQPVVPPRGISLGTVEEDAAFAYDRASLPESRAASRASWGTFGVSGGRNGY